MASKIDICIHGCSTRHRQGGWGAILINKTKPKYTAIFGGAVRNATDDLMEIMSAIQALGMLKRQCEVTLTTESDLVRRIVENRFIHKNHKSLCHELRYLAEEHSVKVNKIKKHTETEGDPRVYALVHEGIQEAKEKARVHKGMLNRIPNHF